MAASSNVLSPSTVLHLLLLFLLLFHEGVASYDVLTSLKQRGINSKLGQAAARRHKIPIFRYGVFSFFPKGTPIPHSGPSDRFNLELRGFAASFANKITKKVPAEN